MTRLDELAGVIGAELRGDGACEIVNVATLADAGPGELSFLSNRRYREQLASTRASAVILEPRFADECPGNALVMANPYLGYAVAATHLNPRPEHEAGVHATAAVSEQATVAPGACIGPQACIESGASVGEGAYIGPGCVVGAGASIGEGTRLVANVVICHGVRIGARVLMHPGVVIGADGFGIANDRGRWVKVPQLGSVVIGDDVEIGANTTIDRGALGDTIIEQGVQLDNLIQVGHNVHIGACTAIAAGVAIAGSARIGKHCLIGGTAVIAGHIHIADGVTLTATTAVAASIDEVGVYSSGMPAQNNRQWRRNIARFRDLDRLAKRVRALERENERAGAPADTDGET